MEAQSVESHCMRCCRYHDLETKYNEQVRQNQITIHIKDLETREKIKELTEKFALESEAERQRYELLQQQKVEAEMEFLERLKAEEVRAWPEYTVSTANCDPAGTSHIEQAKCV